MKTCPSCSFELPSKVDAECPQCGFDLSLDDNATLRLDESAKTIRDEEVLGDDFQSADTLRDGELRDVQSQDESEDLASVQSQASSGRKVEEVDDDDDLFSDDLFSGESATNDELSDSKTLPSAAEQTVGDNEGLFVDIATGPILTGQVDSEADNGVTSIDDDDDLFTVAVAEVNEVGDTGDTILLNPLHTMSRPPIDTAAGSASLESTTASSESGSVEQNADQAVIRSGRASTIAGPKAALEAAEAYSEGLRSLIPPRTMVRKQDSADSSDYQVIKRIGAGAFGVVFRAQQVPLERTVAIKLLQNSSDDKAHQQRVKSEFLREAQFTGRLEHPNIVPVHDIGLTVSVSGKANPFYVMKEIRGQSWHGEIQKNSVKENLEIFKNVVNAIGFAHSQNILHCDLKPDNVMLGEFGEVLVVDWGQAVDLSVPETMRPGGTPAYISPEMANYWIDIYLDRKSESAARAEVGVRSDVYLLGAILFEIVVGYPPHCNQAGQSPYDVIRSAAKNQIVEFTVDNDKELLQIALAALRATDDLHLETIEDLSEAIAEYENLTASIDLRRRADELLQQAIEAKDYDDFQRARFGYEESIQKWNDNQPAIEGLRESKLSCAQQALSDQNFDLGLDVIQDDQGQPEADLRRKLIKGKRSRDSRKRMVFFLTAGLIWSIVAGLAINAYMINQNLRSIEQLDIAKELTAEAEKALAPLRQEAIAKQQEIVAKEAQIAQKQSLIESKQLLIEEFPAKIAKKNAEFNQKIAERENEFQLKEEELQAKMAASVAKFNQESAELEQQKQTLNSQKEQLLAQVVQLNESSKLLRYKSGLNQIEAALDNGEFRDARRQLDQYSNQQDWELKRLNLYAHREIQSLYPDRPVRAIAFAADKLAIGFDNEIQLRDIAQLSKVIRSLPHSNASAIEFSATGDRLFVGEPGANDRSAGKIAVYDLSNSNDNRAVQEIDAQSGSVDEIEFNDDGNLMLAVGRVSKLRQSAGIGLEEPLMVWAEGDRVDVNLVLPDGSKPKFDSAKFSDSGDHILLVNGAGLPRDQQLHIFANTDLGYQWRASCSVAGAAAATFTPGDERSVLAAVTDPKNGEHVLIEWRFAESRLFNAAGSDRDLVSQNVSVVAPLDSKIVQLSGNRQFLIAVDSDRKTQVWDWRTKESLKLRGHAKVAGACFLSLGSKLDTCKVVTAALGNQAELLVTDLSKYQPEVRREQVGEFAADLPPSVTAYVNVVDQGNTIEAFGNNRGTAVVSVNGDRSQWNISAWRSHVASDQFVFARSNEDSIYVYDRKTGALRRVLTGVADTLVGKERITEIQVSADGKTALILTDAPLPQFRVWNLETDRIIRKIDYGQQNLFGTGSNKRLPKLQLSRDGNWVVGAKVGVYVWATRTGQLTRCENKAETAPRTTASSIAFLRNSRTNDFLVSWRDRVSRFAPGQRSEVSTKRFKDLSDATGRSNVLDAVETDRSYQLLGLSRADDRGIVWLDAAESSPVSTFRGATDASFMVGRNVGVVAGAASRNGPLLIQKQIDARSPIRTIDAALLQASAGAARSRGFEKIDWSREAGFLLQTTQRNKQSVRRMWNSFSFEEVDSNAVLGAKVLASPVIDQIVTNGKRVATLSAQTLSFWKLKREGVEPDGVFDQPLSCVALSQDKRLLAVGTQNGRCLILDFETGDELADIELAKNAKSIVGGKAEKKGAALRSLAWHQASSRLAVGFESGRIVQVTVNLLGQTPLSVGKPLAMDGAVTGAVENLVYSQDGVTLVASIPSQGLAIALGEIKDGQPSSKIVLQQSDDQKIVDVDVAANGRRLVTGSDKGQLAIWNIEPSTGTANSIGTQSSSVNERLLLRLANLHQSGISFVRFIDSPDGETIVSSESDSGDNGVIFWPSATTERDAERLK